MNGTQFHERGDERVRPLTMSHWHESSFVIGIREKQWPNVVSAARDDKTEHDRDMCPERERRKFGGSINSRPSHRRCGVRRLNSWPGVGGVCVLGRSTG